MEVNLYKNVVDLINANIGYVKKFKAERFKDKWLIDVFLNNTILNISVGDKIIVNVNNSLNQHVLEFFRDEKKFDNYIEFQFFYKNIIRGYIEKSKGLYVIYNGNEYLCDIEVVSVDPDRQMGPEMIYEITIVSNKNKIIIVASVSEYPVGAFSVYYINDKINLKPEDILDYFHSQSQDEDDN